MMANYWKCHKEVRAAARREVPDMKTRELAEREWLDLTGCTGLTELPSDMTVGGKIYR